MALIQHKWKGVDISSDFWGVLSTMQKFYPGIEISVENVPQKMLWEFVVKPNSVPGLCLKVIVSSEELYDASNPSLYLFDVLTSAVYNLIDKHHEDNMAALKCDEINAITTAELKKSLKYWFGGDSDWSPMSKKTTAPKSLAELYSNEPAKVKKAKKKQLTAAEMEAAEQNKGLKGVIQDGHVGYWGDYGGSYEFKGYLNSNTKLVNATTTNLLDYIATLMKLGEPVVKEEPPEE